MRNIISHKHHAFTLIELLVVISIIALLVAILLPVLSSARVTSQMAVSLSGVRQLCIAQLMYANDNDDKLMYTNYDNADSTHGLPNWAGKLLTLEYVATRQIFWSPGRNTSEINLKANTNQSNPWFYTGYGMNIWASSSEYNHFHGVSTINTTPYPYRLNAATPAPSTFLLLAEPSTDQVGFSYPKSMPGYYAVAASLGTSASINLFTYNGAAVHVYIDGHGSTDSESIGWTATSKFYGKWKYTSSGNRINSPWRWQWWVN